VLKNADSAQKSPDFFVPKTMHNEGNYIISLGNLCRWLAQQAENLGVEIYPGFAAQEALFDENGVVRGSSPATWASTAKATRKKACTPRAWNCVASTRCSPKAAVATSASN
jgi:flavin-dependent dehydrogenase